MGLGVEVTRKWSWGSLRYPRMWDWGPRWRTWGMEMGKVKAYRVFIGTDVQIEMKDSACQTLGQTGDGGSRDRLGKWLVWMETGLLMGIRSGEREGGWAHCCPWLWSCRLQGHSIHDKITSGCVWPLATSTCPYGICLWMLPRKNDEKLTAFRNKSLLLIYEEVTWKWRLQLNYRMFTFFKL